MVTSPVKRLVACESAARLRAARFDLERRSDRAPERILDPLHCAHADALACLEAARGAARAEHPPHVDRPAKALDGLWAEIAVVEQAGNEAKGLRRNEDRVGLGERLQAGGEVGRLADRCLFLGSPRKIA